MFWTTQIWSKMSKIHIILKMHDFALNFKHKKNAFSKNNIFYRGFYRAEGALRFSHVAVDCQITVADLLILAPLTTDIPISYMSPNGTTDVCCLGRS